MENFEEIQPITVSFPKFRKVGAFFLFSTGFFDLVKCDSPFLIPNLVHNGFRNVSFFKIGGGMRKIFFTALTFYKNGIIIIY